MKVGKMFVYTHKHFFRNLKKKYSTIFKNEFLGSDATVSYTYNILFYDI